MTAVRIEDHVKRGQVKGDNVNEGITTYSCYRDENRGARERRPREGGPIEAGPSERGRSEGGNNNICITPVPVGIRIQPTFPLVRVVRGD